MNNETTVKRLATFPVDAVCPNCRNYNALLSTGSHDADFLNFECRDCKRLYSVPREGRTVGELTNPEAHTAHDCCGTGANEKHASNCENLEDEDEDEAEEEDEPEAEECRDCGLHVGADNLNISERCGRCQGRADVKFEQQLGELDGTSEYVMVLRSEYDELNRLRANELGLIQAGEDARKTAKYLRIGLEEMAQVVDRKTDELARQAEEISVLSLGMTELVRQLDEAKAKLTTPTPFEQIFHDITVTPEPNDQTHYGRGEEYQKAIEEINSRPEPFGDGVIVSDKFKPRALFPNASYEGSEVYEIAEANYLKVNDTDLGNGTTILEVVQCFHEQGDARLGRLPECDLTDSNHVTICELIDNENADRFILMQEDNTVGYYDEKPSEGIKAHNERVNTVTGKLRPEQDLFPEDGVDLAMIQNRADENGLSLRTTEKATFTIIEVFQCLDHDRDGRNCAEGDAYDDDDHEKLCELRNDWGGYPNLFYLEDRPSRR